MVLRHQVQVGVEGHQVAGVADDAMAVAVGAVEAQRHAGRTGVGRVRPPAELI